jgi:2-hydroxychromene-2-carboxylate isomerase
MESHVKSAEWYFDFVSPFSYLQLECFGELPQDVAITLRPVVFAGILNHLQHRGPAEIPGKRRFTYRHVQWLARHRGIPLRFPPAHPFNPIRALRLAIALGCKHEVVQTIFRFIWREGRSLVTPDDRRALDAALGIGNADELIQAQWVKDELRGNGERAVSQCVFGVPTFVIDGETFWGLDSTGMVADYLRDAAWFSSDEIARLDALPVGASRV